MFGKKSKHSGTPVTSARPNTAAPKPAETSAPRPPNQAPTQGRGKGEGKLAYETRRAEKNGMGLEKWMAEKDRRARAERDAIAQTRRKSDAERQNQAAKPGLLRRLLDRAHRPF